MKEVIDNKLFPVFLKLENFRVLIVGGGKVALEKVSAIMNNSPATKIKLVATQVSDVIRSLALANSNLEIHQRSFVDSDLQNTDLLISAINNKETSLYIKQLAHKKGILANVADTPEQCDFYLGSIVQKGNVKIAISTNGKSPTLAKRLRETFDQSLPNEINDTVESLVEIRKYLQGDFTEKVNQLNEITAVLTKEGVKAKPKLSKQRIWIYSLTAPVLIFVGYLLNHFLPPQLISDYVASAVNSINSDILIFILAGFTAQMIDGALGMAYGVTATSFLLSAGVPPAASSASVHASEVFTSGVSGLMHLKFGNVNTKLFRNLLLPGVLGAILGAYVLTSLEEYNYIIKPVVSVYTIVLGLLIICKALKKLSLIHI